MGPTSTPVSPLLRLSVVALLAATGAWLRIRGGTVDLATGMLFLSAVCLAATLVVELGMTLLGTSASTRANWRLLVITTGVLVLALEGGLRLGTTRYATYAERNGRPYHSDYKPRVRGWFHVYRPGEHRYEKPEYTHTRRISTLGLTDELPPEKTPGKYPDPRPRRQLHRGHRDLGAVDLGARRRTEAVRALCAAANRHPERRRRGERSLLRVHALQGEARAFPAGPGHRRDQHVRRHGNHRSRRPGTLPCRWLGHVPRAAELGVGLCRELRRADGRPGRPALRCATLPPGGARAPRGSGAR